MKNEKNRIGIYITACCLAVIAAIIGFSEKKIKNEEKPGSLTVEKLKKCFQAA